MNNARRTLIRKVIKSLKTGSFDWDDIEVDLNDILDDETEAMENIPESLQDTERYQICEESVELLEEAIGYIDPENFDGAESVIEILNQINGI